MRNGLRSYEGLEVFGVNGSGGHKALLSVRVSAMFMVDSINELYLSRTYEAIP